MQTLILPFGSAGWNQKICIIEEIISSRSQPPFLYNDVLILVPSSRLKRLYGRIFLDAVERLHGARALVQPEVQTLHQFLHHHFARLRGPRLISENSRLVLLEGLVKEHLAESSLFKQRPDLIAPSLSSVVAKMIEQLSAAGASSQTLSLHITGSDYSEKSQIKLLLEVYAKYEKILRDQDLTDPAGMRMYLHDHFDPAWLTPFRRIILDGIHQATGIEALILKKIASCGDCTLLVDAPSPDLLNSAVQFHPLRIVSEFLSSFGVKPGKDGPGPSPEDGYLGMALFSDRTFAEAAEKAPDPASFSKRINLLSAVNMREEVSLIAGEVKQSLKKGTAPDSILVAFPSLDEYGPLVEEIFTDYGLPYNRALGRQLSLSAVATGLVSLLRTCQEDFSGPSLLRVLSSPFLKFSENPAAAPALDRLLRDRKVIGGKQKILSVLKHHTSEKSGDDVLSEPLTDLFTALAPFSGEDALPLSLWMERLSSLIEWSRIGERTALIKGPLNINLQAFKKMKEALASLTQAGKLFPA